MKRYEDLANPHDWLPVTRFPDDEDGEREMDDAKRHQDEIPNPND